VVLPGPQRAVYYGKTSDSWPMENVWDEIVTALVLVAQAAGWAGLPGVKLRIGEFHYP
jgi:hypothetical protein